MPHCLTPSTVWFPGYRPERSQFDRPCQRGRSSSTTDGTSWNGACVIHASVASPVKFADQTDTRTASPEAGTPRVRLIVRSAPQQPSSASCPARTGQFHRPGHEVSRTRHEMSHPWGEACHTGHEECHSLGQASRTCYEAAQPRRGEACQISGGAYRTWGEAFRAWDEVSRRRCRRVYPFPRVLRSRFHLLPGSWSNNLLSA